MSSASEPRSAPSEATELASPWHTAALIALMLAVAIAGTWLTRSGPVQAAPSAPPVSANARIFGQYLPILIVNWGLTAYVARLFRARNALPVLIGQRWHDARRAVTDLALAVGLAALIQAIQVLSQPRAVGRNAALSALLPSTGAERLTWLLVALSVGFCEEVVYRGYLQAQLAAFTRRVSVGIFLQALLFGIAHLEQGPAAALRIALYGLLLGVLAHFRRSLLPGIACHIGIDLASAFLR